MLYRFLRLIVGIGIRFYYKEVKVLNRKELGQVEGEPLIIIANHPNTLMDAMLLGFVCKQPIHYIAKGTLFNSKFKLWILQKLYMIPINRKGEEKVAGISNQDTFETCYQILEQGKTLVIFPEGTSFLERQLRELKTGTARIALEIVNRSQGKSSIKVLPVGLNYLRAEKFRSSVIVNVGKKIVVQSYFESYQSESSKTAKRLTEQFRVALEQLLVNSSSKEDESLVDDVAQIIASKYLRNQSSGVEGDLLFIKKVRDRLDELNLIAPWKVEEIKKYVAEIKAQLKAFQIKTDFLDRRFRLNLFFRQLIFAFVALVGLFPLFVIGLITNIFQFKFTDYLIPKLSKDIEYYAPLAVLIGLFIYPISYGLFLFVLSSFIHFSSLEKVLIYFSFPVFGMTAYSYSKFAQHISSKLNYISHMLNHRKIMLEIQQKRQIIRNYILEQ